MVGQGGGTAVLIFCAAHVFEHPLIVFFLSVFVEVFLAIPGTLPSYLPTSFGSMVPRIGQHAMAQRCGSMSVMPLEASQMDSKWA